MKTVMRTVTDLNIMLECLYEAYGMEGELLKSGKNVHATMIYPFIKMIVNQCSGLTAEKVHKKMWEVYEKNLSQDRFVEMADQILESYKKTGCT